MEIKDLEGFKEQILDKIGEKVAERDEEIKNVGQASEKHEEKIADLDKSLQDLSEELKEATQKVAEMAKDLQEDGRPGFMGEDAIEYKSLGERFAESDQYKQIDTGMKGKIAIGMDVGSFDDAIRNTEEAKALRQQNMQQKALASGTILTNPLIQPLRVPGFIAAPDRVLRARDLFPVQQTNVPAVEFVEETGFTNAAAPVAEGALKPESDLTFALRSVTAKVIAHHIRASRQILSDAAMLQAYINNRLVYGLKLVEDAQLLYGDGTGENLQGVLTHPDRQTYTQAAAPDTKIDALRRAMTLVTVAEYPVTGAIVNDFDWEDIELAKGSDGHYLWLAAQGANVGTTNLFRVPFVVTRGINEGEFALGAFQQAAQIYDVWAAQVQLSDQHADIFLRNQVIVRAEERLMLANYRPEAFVHGTFL